MKRAFWLLALVFVSLVLVMTPRAQAGRTGKHDEGKDEGKKDTHVGSRGDKDNPQEPQELAPSGKGWGELRKGQDKKAASRPSGSNGIYYRGGPLMLGTTNIYYIWYGNWAGNTATTILSDLARSIGGSPYFNINTTYYDGTGTRVSNSVRLSPSVYNDNYSKGKALGDSDVWAVVSNAISSGGLQADANGSYFVLTSADVNETSGFCTQYCGWHSHASKLVGASSYDIKFAFVGNPDRCPNACEMQTTKSPNGNPGADGMASIVAHELEESVTDPDLNAWYDARGWENADKCAWTFGSVYSTANGSYANMNLGYRDSANTLHTRDFLIQQNWVNAYGGYCAKSY